MPADSQNPISLVGIVFIFWHGAVRRPRLLPPQSHARTLAVLFNENDACASIIGGLLVSTGLSLVFVPAIFILMDDAQRLLARLFGRLVTRDAPARTTSPTKSNDEAGFALAAE